jgi:hypothetical protein
MSKYVDIVLTTAGEFCAAPPWTVQEGDLVSLQNTLSGKDELREVACCLTAEPDGEFANMIEKYIGFPLPKVNARFKRSEVAWDAVSE